MTTPSTSGIPRSPGRPARTGDERYERRPSSDGPGGRSIAGALAEYGRDPLGSMRRWRDRHGDLVPIRFGPFRAHVAFGPAEVGSLLIDHAADTRKSLGTRMLIPLLGHGLLTADGTDWRRHRRMAAPAFHRERVAGYADAMVRFAVEAADSWRDGDVVDVHAEMTALTLRIVARVLFDADVTPRIEEVARLGGDVQDFYFDRFASLRFLVPTWLPTPGNRRLRRAIARLDRIVSAIVAERDPRDDRGDLLSMLLTARDERGVGLDGRQVRDEVMTLLLAGHETTALALTWAMVLLDGHPDVRSRLIEEVKHVLIDRPATAADAPALRYTAAVVNETLRLYPPAYATGRETLRPIDLAGTPIPRGHVVFTSMSTIHRDPRFFPEPDRFMPERWLDGLERRLPRGAFIPFGLGPRKCIGASFAMLEATLLLATIVPGRRLDLLTSEIPVHPAITLRPRGPVRAVVRATTLPRKAAAATA